MSRKFLLGLAALGLSGCVCDYRANPKTSACLLCRQFVRERLKAPSTADFQPCYESVVRQGAAANIWTVASWVDAENSFGAKIRTTYVCQLEDTGDGNWRLLALEDI
jgi:hypothetical protein